jgi:hypothetical protein
MLNITVLLFSLTFINKINRFSHTIMVFLRAEIIT